MRERRFNLGFVSVIPQYAAFCFSGGNEPVLVSCWIAERKFLSLLRYKEETTVSGQYQGSVQKSFLWHSSFLTEVYKNALRGRVR